MVLIGLIGAAQLSLVGFALSGGAGDGGGGQSGLAALSLFANGMSLGMVWGLVLAYLEGRRASELMMAILSCAYVVASGIVKDVGKHALESWGVSEHWMPATVGALFFLPFVGFTLALDRTPDPSADDQEARAPRRAMSVEERRSFTRNYALGLIPMLLIYIAITALLDYRDSYGADIFAELGVLETQALFTRTELPAALLVLLSFAGLIVIRDNRRALSAIFAVMIAGCVTVAAAALLLWAGALDGVGFMILLGVGTYLCYVPFGAMLFERLMAATRSPGTAVFGVYIADFLGYCGSIALQLYRDLGHGGSGGSVRVEFFTTFCLLTGASGVVLLSGSLVFFRRRTASAGSSAQG